MAIRKWLLRFCFIGLLSTSIAHTWGVSALSVQESVANVHHTLSAELIPAAHELVASDQIDLEVNPQVTSVTFTLANTLHVESIAMRAHSVSGGQGSPDEVAPFTRVRPPETTVQRIVISLPKDHGRSVTLVMSYRGQINDPPREPRHLRFVTPSETSGHIGLEGVYLSGESQWYPDVIGSFSTYRVSAQIPQGWTVVASGRKEGETTSAGKTSSTWIVQDQSEAFTLVANKFVTTSREWKSPTGQRVELQTHFLPDNAGLAEEYLDATARYLDAYVRILGNYPFDKFSVVENFFASGLGLPSFTLLGSGSIKRHYIQPYALGLGTVLCHASRTIMCAMISQQSFRARDLAFLSTKAKEAPCEPPPCQPVRCSAHRYCPCGRARMPATAANAPAGVSCSPDSHRCPPRA